MKRLSFLAVFLCVLLTLTRAEAATVALLRPVHDTPAINEALHRLQGELLAVGLAVAMSERPTERDAEAAQALEWFDSVASERAIDAFIDVVGDANPVGVDVWICERALRCRRASRVTLEPNTENAAATLAIRAIEVLRSNFLVLDLAEGAKASKPVAEPSSPERPSPPPERVARLGLEAGATALTSVDGVGWALLPFVRADWALLPWLTLQVSGAGLGSRPRVTTPDGSVDVAQSFGVLGLCACSSARAGLHPFFALSAGALRTALEGRANAPNLGHRVQRWSFLADASAGARLALPNPFYLSLAAHLQLAAPYVAIHSPTGVAATTGLPNLLVTLTAGARL